MRLTLQISSTTRSELASLLVDAAYKIAAKEWFPEPLPNSIQRVIQDDSGEEVGTIALEVM